MLAIEVMDLTLPLVDPVLRFLVILVIILLAPLLLNKIRIPHLLGLIISGAIIGPYGFNIIERDSSIILSGTAGLLYIMFLAGLEIDLGDFKKNSTRSIVFGLYTFVIPMILGILAGIYLLDFSLPTSILLASMFASHTLIAYPLVSKLGVARNRAVNITVGGTMITDTLALLVLAIIVGLTTGEVNTEFWVRLFVSIAIFGLAIIFLFPIIGRWFFKTFDDNVTQYIFVLVMVFLGAVMAELAGIEPIIGAFLSGLALNRLIPHTSPLMNRVEFVGNAIFIPFFLIGVGMLVDYRAFFKDFETIKVAGIMIIVATLSKYAAAFLTQKTYKFTVDERRLIFGLSNAQAAATLAAVLVGYNIIIEPSVDGSEPVRLLNESVLNGTILMILFTCTLASFVAQKGAKNIALAEASSHDAESSTDEKILIALNNINSVDELIHLGLTVKSKANKDGIYALCVVDDHSIDSPSEKQAKKLLVKAATTAASTDVILNEIFRYDLNIVNAINAVILENKITDVILGLHGGKGISSSFLGNLTEGILTKSNTTTLVYKPLQPFGTIKRHLVIIPQWAEKELGFPFWLSKIWNIARNSGADIHFYAHTETLKYIEEVHQNHPIECFFHEFNDWNDFLIIAKDLNVNDNVIIILSRKDKPSYHHSMERIPNYLNNYFKETSYILIYPMQIGVRDRQSIDFKNPTFLEPLEKLDEIGQTMSKIFKKKF